jgi:glycosyltransferase involved in cell wall biosynthesis
VHIVLDLQACQSPESRRRGIGRYSLALAKAMAAYSRGHEITILLNAGMGGAIEDLRGQFDGLLPQSRIVTWDGLSPTAHLQEANGFRRHASEVLREQVLQRLKPDVVHVASLVEGLADDVVATITAAPKSHVTAVTLYDLIPLAHPEAYLADSRVRRWYMEKIDHLRVADVLLGISRFSCDEAIELLDIAPERLTDISGAADSMFRPLENAESFRQEITSRYGLSRSFVMYAGGFDARKNIASLIRAFALLPQTVRSSHQLAIVGGAPESERLSLQEVMRQAGVTQEEVVFTGYVSDTDLVKLYNLCALYVFPSLQEGFGLPALEAMSSGAIVIGSNTSSLPEVIGHDDALFDPRDPQSIADKMMAALTDSSLRDVLREHGRIQPLKFSWQESASRAIAAFESAVVRHARPAGASVRAPRSFDTTSKVAYLPAPGVDTHKRDSKAPVVYADGDCFGSSAHRSLESFQLERDRFGRVIIEIADHPYCAKTLPLAATGTVDFVLRDRTFGAPLQVLASEVSSRELVNKLLYSSGGYAALAEARAAGYSAKALGDLVTAGSLRAMGCSQITESQALEPGGVDAFRWRDYVSSMVTKIAAFERDEVATDQDWHRIAATISRDVVVPEARAPQWLVDISNLFVRDAGTGIQRVVRHILDEQINSPPAGYRVEPVCLGDDGVFRYARSYCARRYFPGEALPADDPVEFIQGDVYLGLDLVAHLIPAYIDRFRDLRNRGIRQYFVVYDLLC